MDASFPVLAGGTAPEMQTYAAQGITVTTLRVMTPAGTYLARAIVGADVVRGEPSVVGALQWIAIWCVCLLGMSGSAGDRIVGQFVLAFLIGGVGFFTRMKHVARLHLPSGPVEIFSANNATAPTAIRDAVLGVMRPS
jgi:hypothetical protein